MPSIPRPATRPKASRDSGCTGGRRPAATRTAEGSERDFGAVARGTCQSYPRGLDYLLRRQDRSSSTNPKRDEENAAGGSLSFVKNQIACEIFQIARVIRPGISLNIHLESGIRDRNRIAAALQSGKPMPGSDAKAPPEHGDPGPDASGSTRATRAGRSSERAGDPGREVPASPAHRDGPAPSAASAARRAGR